MTTGQADQLNRARRVIADLRKRLADVQAADNGAIAVVGMACRFPGEASDVDGYWRMVAAGHDAIGPVPDRRARDMQAEAGQSVALLDDIETFDAAFFDIAPREAVQMDPQQRLFLEVAWEALEDAGQTRSGLAGSLTGVFVGVHNHSSGYLELQTADPSKLNEYSATGSGHDVIAGRLAYVFDLRGPSAVINTACSSSLVAVHMACQSLRSRDCRMAVAGGVNLILGPMQSRLFGLGAMLAPDGRCKTFDARANGYGRGEGCGAVVLKRLSDATADRDRVIAVIRGSAVNQDGRTNGLTAPSGLSQQELIRQALKRAGLAASRIGFVEAHGTGTALGDPIEVEALATVYGVPVEGAAPCFLGSAKSNINHLEGAAGIAGLIRAILIVREGIIPPVAGLERLNPHLSLDGTRLAVPVEAVEWRSDVPRIAAVSAFGWSGVNAHVLVEQGSAVPSVTAGRPTIILVSASDRSALSGRAARLADALETLPDEALESFAWTATARRSHYSVRIAVAGGNRAELAQDLRRVASGPPASSPDTVPSVGFLIGDDAASGALGTELMAEDQVFRSAVDACMAGFEGAPAGDFASLPVPARSFAFAVGIGTLLTHWGIRSAAIAGWGAGAAAAAYLAGEASLAEAVRRVRQSASDPGGSADAAARLARAGVTHAVRLDRLFVEGMALAPAGSARLRLMHVLAGLAASGVDLVWDAIYASTAQLVSLPAHQFHRRRHWISESLRTDAAARPAGGAPVPANWFFETRWQPEPPQAGGGDRSAPLNWLILGEPDGPGDQLASRVRGGDGRAARLASVDGAQLQDITSHGAWAVVDLRALDRRTGPVGADVMRLARQVVALDRGLDQLPPERPVKIWIVTRGAHSIRVGAAPDLASAPLWGLCRSLILDHPKLWGGLVDLDPSGPFDAGQLHREIAAGAADADETAFRAGLRYVNRIASVAPPAGDTLRLDPVATYLVTGAFGGIGPALAVWLAQRGARSLVLAARTVGDGADAAHPSFALSQRLRTMGVDARLEPCDVGDRRSVEALFDRIRAAGVPLRGVFHAAGAASEPVASIEDADLAAAFRPKVDGGLFLDEQSRAHELDFFVLFSSAAGVLGARARGHYAAANAFLDGLAAWRRADGLPALSVNWGLWSTEGAAHMPYFERVGLNPMAPETALDVLARLLSEQAGGRRDLHPLIASLDGDRLQSALELQGRARFFSALVRQTTVPVSEASQVLIEQLRNAPTSLRRGRVVELIAAEVRAVMEMAPEDTLSVDRGFFDLGMGSLMTVALKTRLEKLFGVGLPSTLVMDYPSIAALSLYFETAITGRDPVASGPVAPAAVSHATPDPGLARPAEELSDDEVGDALAAELTALDLELLP